MILMVDDEPKYVEPYLDELKMRYGEDRVRFFNTVDEAWKHLEADLEDIQLLILDIMMAPGNLLESEQTNHGLRTGVKLVEQVHKLVPTLPIIALSNVTDERVAERFRGEGLRWLSKSETFPEELSDEVDELLKQFPGRRAEAKP